MSKKKGVVGKVIEDLAESTRAVHAINRDNLAAVKADTRANFVEATTPDPDFVKFKEAEGLGEKAKVVVESIRTGARENSAAEKARRAKIRSHESYQRQLEEQRAARQATINGTD